MLLPVRLRSSQLLALLALLRQVDVGANSTGLVNAGGDPPSDITSYGSWRTWRKR